MSHVFISYSRKDKVFALNLKQQLETSIFEGDKAFDVWMDSQDIASGDLWKESILKGIETCSAFVIILSPSSERSHWVMRELTYAHEFGKPIFPILADGGVWPIVEDINCVKSVEELKKGLNRLTRLFISYAPEDADFADSLRKELEDIGANIWQGENASQSIAQASDSCQVILLILSPEAMSSARIREEWQTFDNKGKDVLPILVRQTRVPVRIRNKQPYINFFNQDYQIAFAQLYGVLHSYGINLKAREKVNIPPQPHLPLSRDDMINEAKEAVWISAIVHDMFSQNPKILEKALEHNSQLHVRLLMPALDVKLANETGSWVGTNETIAESQKASPMFEEWLSQQNQELTDAGLWIAQRLFATQQILKETWGKAKDRLEIRVVPYRLATGYFMIDPIGEAEGMLTASPYFYQIGSVKAKWPLGQTAPPIFLSKNSPQETDRWWFEQYVQEFIHLWEAATPWKQDNP